MDLLADIFKLRHHILQQYPEFILDKRSLSTLHKELQQLLNRATRIETLYSSTDLSAVIILNSKQISTLGIDKNCGYIFCKNNEPNTQAWILKTVEKWRHLLDDNSVLTLEPAQRPLLPKLMEHELSVQALILHGSPTKALESLDKTLSKKQSIHQHGLHFETLSSIEQVEQLVKNRQEYFTNNPQNSPIATQQPIGQKLQEQINRFVYETLVLSMQNDPKTHFIILQSNKVVGSFGLILDKNNPMLGYCAGVEIFLQPSIQERGVGTLAYHMLLERMVSLGVRMFKGTTANPAVIHLARKMQRPLRGWKLTPGSCSALPVHFDYPAM